MSKFEKIGNITISPTLITDKETEYGLHERKEPLTDAPEGVTSWNDLTDKPFEEVEAIEEEIYNQTIPLDDLRVMDATVPQHGCFMLPFADNVFLDEGKLYRIISDGIDYGVLEAKPLDEGYGDTMAAVTLGSNSFDEKLNPMFDAGVPFTILSMRVFRDGELMGSTLGVNYKGAEIVEHTLIIREVIKEGSIETIETKYLPEHLQFGGEMPAEIPVIENVSGSWEKGERPGVDFDGSYTFNTGETYKVVYEASISGDTVSGTYEGVVDEYGSIAVPCSTYTLNITVSSAEISGYSFAGSLTLSIHKLGSVVETLDAKYLPKGSAIPDVTEAPTAEQFNALLASLREAGVLAQ